MGTTRITYQGACVLQALSRGSSYGFDIMEFTGLPSGTVYPVLRRFEEHGLVESEWEEETVAHEDGRPRRRHYRLSSEGQETLAVAAERLALHRQMFPIAAEAGDAT